MFTTRAVSKSPATRSAGTRLASDSLKGRVFEINLADLKGNEEDGYRKMKLVCEEVQGKNLLTNFHGMDMTRDKLCSLVRKWQSLIESWADVKTTDGYTVRMFCIGFTAKRRNQVKKTCYAQSAQTRQIRKKMQAIMTQEGSKVDLKELVKRIIPRSIAGNIEKACYGIYPLKDVYIRKVKILKAPKFDREFAPLLRRHCMVAVGRARARACGCCVRFVQLNPTTDRCFPHGCCWFSTTRIPPHQWPALWSCTTPQRRTPAARSRRALLRPSLAQAAACKLAVPGSALELRRPTNSLQGEARLQ